MSLSSLAVFLRIENEGIQVELFTKKEALC